MKALYLLNFWRPTAHKDHQTLSANSGTTEMPNAVVFTDYDFEEGEDSFFELELTVPDFDNNEIISDSNRDNPSSGKDSNKTDFNEETLHNSAKETDNRQDNCPKSAVSLPPTDLLSKRKILPIEPFLKPQSPISLLKSAPRFRVLMFKKWKSTAEPQMEKTGETEWNGVFVDTQKHKKNESKRFKLKLKLEEAANGSAFTRDNSLRRKMFEESVSDEPSKQSSKQGMQKYLKLINPLYLRVSKRQREGINFSLSELSISSASSSPVILPAGSPKKEKQGSKSAGIRVVCKHLGKSKSSPAMAGVSQRNVSRRDDSLLVQHDGIQSAILHCKNSFNSSRDSSVSTRFASDPLPASSMDSPRISKEENGVN